ncbi:MAG: vitamin K epoxide reductase [Verrucomicrobia bacterium]|nr:vitamin K epoxide reductase [Verrucomicrobiota bacterium]
MGKQYRYQPSAMGQRVLICFIAAIAVIVATYMGLYEWQLIDSVWDPVFGKETEDVLNSEVSHILRIWMRLPDAVMGSVAYLGDILFALAGSVQRWKDRPWLVLLFGLDVIPLSGVSATLVLLQGTVVGAWCFPCLITAAVSITLMCLAYDEVRTSILLLIRVWKRTRDKRFVWDTFWGKASQIAEDEANRLVEERENRRNKACGRG